MAIAGSVLDSLTLWWPDRSIETTRDVATSVAASAVRGWSGAQVGRLGHRPAQPLILFEREPCPDSRLVREALSILDLDAEMRPCPEGELAHRAELKTRGGRERVPYLIDPNSGARLHERGRILHYLFEAYGAGPVPRSLATVNAHRRSRLASTFRGHAGGHKAPARRPRLPLELYGYEAGPRTRLVREQLSAFALPWICRSRAHGSPRRGYSRVPFLRDPNTGRTLVGSDPIRTYLRASYGR